MSEFLFGSGFAIAGGDLWRVRRKAVGPALHRAYLQTMVDRVFGPSAEQLCAKLEVNPKPYTCLQTMVSRVFGPFTEQLCAKLEALPLCAQVSS